MRSFGFDLGDGDVSKEVNNVRKRRVSGCMPPLRGEGRRLAEDEAGFFGGIY